MAVGLVDHLETVQIDEEQCRTGSTVHPLDPVREVQAAPQSGQDIGVGLDDQTLRLHPGPLCPGGENLRHQQPDADRQEESHPQLGRPRSLHDDPGRADHQDEEGTNPPCLGQSDVDEDQGEEA
jgi:hypothetical protein